MKLAIASLFTLSVLFAFLAAVVAGFLYFTGVFSFAFVIIFTAVIFFLQWILSPYISDIVFRMLYGLQWIKIEGLREKDAEAAKFVEETCKKHNIKVPKIGFIPDDNPQAFCYGSGAFNSRLAFTQGIIKYLDTNERKAVLAHELGHIIHRDFIIMTLAAFILSLLYHFSQMILRSRSRGNGENKKGNAAIIVAGAVSYILYIIGTYIVLYLSRVREYFADEFSAKEMDNTDYLSSALVKIAYGIIANPDEKKSSELMKGTRSLGIMDFKAAKEIGVAYLTSKKTRGWKGIDSIFLFDLYSPWAWLSELSSTHPLTAKRIRRMSEKIKDVSMFDFDEISKHPKIDKAKLYSGFAKDAFFNFMPSLMFMAFIASLIAAYLEYIQTYIPLIAAVSFGVFSTAKVFYRYPFAKHASSNTLELMRNVYASPIKGNPVTLKGVIVGRGIPGLIFSEDMMFQDETGLIYLNYEGMFPFLSNIIFALFKIDNIIGKEVEVQGWFLRSLSSRLELKTIKTKEKTLRSWITFWMMFGNLFLTLVFLVASLAFLAA